MNRPGTAWVLLLVHLAHERLHVARLDLGETEADAAVSVGMFGASSICVYARQVEQLKPLDVWL